MLTTIEKKYKFTIIFFCLVYGLYFWDVLLTSLLSFQIIWFLYYLLIYLSFAFSPTLLVFSATKKSRKAFLYFLTILTIPWFFSYLLNLLSN